MRIAVAQINPIVGDLEGNIHLCFEAVEEGKAKDADLIVFPEMAIPGCHPRDILFDPSFAEAVISATKSLAETLVGYPPVILGSLMRATEPSVAHPGLFNAAVLVHEGKLKMLGAKQILPTDDVNMEPRWFVPGEESKVNTIAGKKIVVLVGDAELGQKIPEDAELLIVLAASPFTKTSYERRLAKTRQGIPLVYVNLVGGNDELIYDGRSFAVDHDGELIDQLADFKSEVALIDLNVKKEIAPAIEPEELLFEALVVGLRDFFHKNRLKQAFLGVSGGIDSALVACIAAEALDPENVTGVAIPSRYTDPRSTETAKELCQNLGVHFELLDLKPLHAAAETTFGDLLSKGNGAENVQARLRMVTLMAYINRYGGVLLNTGNKTEASLGYATIYGDTAGTICPIGDLIKPEVYALARWINQDKEIIPQFTIDRKPSAELRPDQEDPFDYEVISPQIDALVHQNQSNHAMRNAEHKRWQSGVVLKVSKKSFGSGRLIPITRK